MNYNVSMTFRDNVVHKIKIGEDIQVAYSFLKEISSSLINTKTFNLKNESGEIIFTTNLDNFLFAFIEGDEKDEVNT
jgi:hypothetical protein